MEMIIGGAYQGKTEYARKQYPQLRWSDGGFCHRGGTDECSGCDWFSAVYPQ